MAHVKAAGTTRNLRDSNPKYLGVKKHDGEVVKPGQVIIRQRGTKYRVGKNVKRGKDDTLFAMADGTVRFMKKKVKLFTGHLKTATIVNVVPAETK